MVRRTIQTSDNNGIDGANSHSTAQSHHVHDERDDGPEGSASESADLFGFSKLSIKSEATQSEPPAEENNGADDGEASVASTPVGRFCGRAPSSGAEAPPNFQHGDALVAFCAGSALGNGKADCSAGYACLFPFCPEWKVATRMVDDRATNMRADYLAVLNAMMRANEHDPARKQELFIYSSCKILIDSMTKWIKKWVVKNWRKAGGGLVENRDILKRLLKAQGDRCIQWRHVKAHTGLRDWESEWHDEASLAAQSAAQRAAV